MDLSTLTFVLGRVIFGGYFVLAGLNHFSHLTQMSQVAAAHGLPVPRAAVLGSGVLLVFAGASVVAGWYPLIGSLGLVLFLLSAAVLFHNFWAVPEGNERFNQLTHFLKNVALAGAALLVGGGMQPW